MTQSQSGLFAAIFGALGLFVATVLSPSLYLPHQRTALAVVAAVLVSILVIGGSRLPARTGNAALLAGFTSAVAGE